MLGTAQEAVALCNYFAGMSKKPRLGLSGGEASSAQRCMTLLKHMGMGQNPIPLVNIKIAGKWMFIPLKMVCIGIDP